MTTKKTNAEKSIKSGRRTGDPTGNQNSPARWMEALVAELSACFVLAILDLPDRLEELPTRLPSRKATSTCSRETVASSSRRQAWRSAHRTTSSAAAQTQRG